MPAQNYFHTTTFLKKVGPAPLNYIPIAGIPGSVGGAPFAEAAKQYASTDDMLADGYLTTAQEVLAATQVFGQGAFIEDQTKIPTRVVIINRVTPQAQQDEFEVLNNDAGTWRLFIGYPFGNTAVEAASFIAVAETIEQIKDGLLTSLGLGAFAGIVTGASVDASTGSVTADVAGVPFLLTAVGPNGVADFDLTSIAVSIGLFDDLDAGWKVSNFWAVIPDPGEVAGVMYESSRWVQDSAKVQSERRNIALLQTTDADILSGTLPNFNTPFGDLAWSRSFPLYHPDLSFSDRMSSAWSGRYGALTFGRRGWHTGLLGGTALKGELNYTQLEVETAQTAGVALVERLNGPEDPLRVMVRNGNAEGVFPIQWQAIDYWWLRMNAAQITVVQNDGDSGVNLDETGIGDLVDAVDIVNAELATNGVIDPDRTTVTPVPLSDVPLDQQAIGDYKTVGGVEVDTVLIPKIRATRVSGTFANA